MEKFTVKRIVVIAVMIFIAVVIIILTRLASEQNGTTSNIKSGTIVNYFMENMITNGLPVNRDDTFWRLTANVLLRKAAHFIEYFLLGMTLSVIFNLFTRKVWITVPLAATICFLLAYLDEYRQQFVEGRASTWFDVRIDTYGSLTGIILVTIFFVIYNAFQTLKKKVYALEEELEKKLNA